MKTNLFIAVWSIFIDPPGYVQVEQCRRTNCMPGSVAAMRFPRLTQGADGNACQLGARLPLEIEGLPSLAEINR